MQPNSKTLKLQARKAMSQSRPSFVLVALVFFLLVSVLPNVIYEVFDASLTMLIIETVESATSGGGAMLDVALIGLFVTLVVQLISMVIQLGYSLWGLRCWRHEEENGFASLFEGFSMVGKLLLTNLIVALNIAGWSFLLLTALSTVISPLLFTDATLITYILVPFYFVTSCIAVMLIYIRYTMVPFVLIDRPELGVFRVIAQATILMRANLWRLFRLYLSFIWWYLASGLLTWGISFAIVYFSGQLLPNLGDPATLLLLTNEGIAYWAGLAAGMIFNLFLTPYVTVTVAGFYDNLIQPPPLEHSSYHNEIY